MIEQSKITSRNYDTPIPKPPDELFERFIRSTKARFVTKRLSNETRRPRSERSNDELEAR